MLPSAFDRMVKSRGPGITKAAWFGRQQRMVAYYPPGSISGVPFLIAVGIDADDILAQVSADAGRGWLVLALVLACTLLAAWFFAARYVRQPLNGLAQTVRSWREGDTTARVGSLNSGSEFDDLAHGFDALADAVVERQRRLQGALENTTDSVAMVASDWTITFLNRHAIESMRGVTDPVGRSLWEIYPSFIDEPIGRGLRSAMLDRRRVTVAFENLDLGEHFETNAYPADDGGLILFSRNVTEERRAYQELQRLAHEDPLTGLANRPRAVEIARRAEARGELSALLILDLDLFKHVNDSLGHPAGDAVLRQVAERLVACVGQSGVVARLGGDEFIVLMRQTSPENCHELAERLLYALESSPFNVSGRYYDMSGSAGLALFDRSISIEELMANADLALYRAKALGGGQCCTYAQADRDAYQALRQLEEEVALGVVNSEFELFYQPQVNLQSGALVGAEALLRWRHPSRGVLPPAEFLDVLSASRHAVAVGTWVLEEACRQAAAWRQAGMELRMSVNLFAQQLGSRDLPQIVLAALHRHELPAHSLELEVTENITLAARPEIKQTLIALHTSGVRLAFDDFGTGFASLTTLKNLPVHRLKIDKSFVKNLPGDMHDMAIVEAVLALAGALGLQVVAEGVETAEQESYLRSRGCSVAQGYRFGRPMTSTVFGETMFSVCSYDRARDGGP